jgi:hypothetical protein
MRNPSFPMLITMLLTALVTVGLCGTPTSGTIATTVLTIEAPDDLVIEGEARTLIDLLHKEKPTIWQLSCDCCHMLHVKATVKNIEFVASAAYRFKHKGRLVWGKISSKNWSRPTNNRSVADFLCQKYQTETLRSAKVYSPDGNHSFYKLLSSDKGRRLYNVVCASNGGWRAHQEIFWSCLVYVDAANTPHLACETGFMERSGKCGGFGIGRSFSRIEVSWKDDKLSPFKVNYTEETFYYVHGEEPLFTQDYSQFRDGILEWTLPMPRGDWPNSYLKADGKKALRAMAYIVCRYQSIKYDDRAKAAWLDAFRKANPKLDVDKVLAKGAKIIMPDENAVRETLSKTN